VKKVEAHAVYDDAVGDSAVSFVACLRALVKVRPLHRRGRTHAMRRLFPAIALLLLSPLVAEFLLGDVTVRQLGFVAFFLPQYGCGALLVRELARRQRRGWPMMLLLALAYALIEEGLTTQSLFNPNYAHERLLDYGYIDALGTSLNWAVFVLTLHVVWSIGSPIALAEALAGGRWDLPWLGVRGLIVVAAGFVLGCSLTIASTYVTYPFTASPSQLATVAILAGTAIYAAYRLFRSEELRLRGPVPSPWILGTTSFLLCSAFHLLDDHSHGHGLPAGVTLAGMLAVVAMGFVLLWIWSNRDEWTPQHPLGAAGGAILTYGWVGLTRMIGDGVTGLGVPTTLTDTIGQALLLATMVGVIAVGSHRLRREVTPAFR
jgi:hypothetical protein